MQKYGNSPLINTEGKRTVMPSTRAVSIFEGSFDFLSWQVLQNSKTPTTDILVLNSVNNLDKATGYLNLHENFICFLDNDQDASALKIFRKCSLAKKSKICQACTASTKILMKCFRTTEATT